MATATIEVEKVFNRTVPSGSVVYDLRTSDGQKFSAWDDLGAKISAGTWTVEYVEKENNGFLNKTVKKAERVGGGLSPSETQTITRAPSPDERSKQINRSVAFKAAVDLYTAAGSVKGNLEDVIALNELTDALIPVVEGVGVVNDGFLDLEDS